MAPGVPSRIRAARALPHSREGSEISAPRAVPPCLARIRYGSKVPAPDSRAGHRDPRRPRSALRRQAAHGPHAEAGFAYHDPAVIPAASASTSLRPSAISRNSVMESDRSRSSAAYSIAVP